MTLLTESQIRDDQTRRCIEALPICDDPIAAYISGIEALMQVHSRLTALLSPDQRGQPEDISQKLQTAIGVKPATPFTLCPETVRRCIEALPELRYAQLTSSGMDWVYRDSCSLALQALLPVPPDPAKELFQEICPPNTVFSRDFSDGAHWVLERLFTTGKLQP